MTSELKYDVYCPFCGEGLLFWGATGSMRKCPKCDNNLLGNKEIWQALIQAKQDLEITTKVLEKLNCEYNRCRDEEFEGADIDWEWWAMAAKNVVETALEQITHDNSEKANNGEHKEI